MSAHSYPARRLAALAPQRRDNQSRASLFMARLWYWYLRTVLPVACLTVYIALVSVAPIFLMFLLILLALLVWEGRMAVLLDL